MEIEEEDSIVKNVLQLVNGNSIPQALDQLLEIEKVNVVELDRFIESPILKIIFQHYIRQVESSQKLTKQQLNQLANLLIIIERISSINDKRLSLMLIKSHIKDLISKLITIQEINLQILYPISSLAKIIPEIFTTQFILTLQRSLIEKCANPSLRLEHFLRIFYNLREHSSVYQFDCYFYVNFLKIQFQNNKLTRQSIILIDETLQHLIRFEENTEETTIKSVFELVTEYLFPRLCLEYNICNKIGNNSDDYDQEIQQKFFTLMNLFVIYDYKPCQIFISKNIQEIENILLNVKRCKTPLINVSIVLELINYCLLSPGAESIQIIDHLLMWDQFQKVIDDLTCERKRQNNKNQNDTFLARKIKQLVCDMLINMLNKNLHYVVDYFINEYLIGQLVDLTTFLDSKRRQIGIEFLAKIMKYIEKQPFTKFIVDNSDQNNDNHITNESTENEDQQCQQFAPYKSNKLILTSLSDLFEVASLPYDTNKIIPTYYIKMQQQTHKVKLKLYKLFGHKFTISLRDQVDLYETNMQTKNTQDNDIQDDWEDIDEDNQENYNYFNLNDQKEFNILDFEFMDDDDDDNDI